MCEWGVASGAGVILLAVVNSAVDFTAGQRQLLYIVAAIATPLWIFASYAVKRRHLSAMRLWLESRGNGPLPPDETASAFAQATNFPKRLATFCAVFWATVTYPVGLMLPLMFDGWTSIALAKLELRRWRAAPLSACGI